MTTAPAVATTANSDGISNDVRPHDLECLERALEELQVLEAIYGAENDDADHAAATNSSSPSFAIASPSSSQLDQFREWLSDPDTAASMITEIPIIDIQLRLPISLAENVDDEGDQYSSSTPLARPCAIYCQLPPGYPEHNPCRVAMIEVEQLPRATREEITATLNQQATAWCHENQDEGGGGGEVVVLQLLEQFQELVRDAIEKQQQQVDSAATCSADESSSCRSRFTPRWSRRYIWVHHITDAARCKSIVEEARQARLVGYLKSGYPGVVVMEGLYGDCDDFVSFIKGNKSRPGGFGRNWGHHVRGQIDFDTEQDKRILCTAAGPFEHIGEDLAVLGKACKDCGIDNELKEYVLQHKGG